jgi:hypothetical protein
MDYPDAKVVNPDFCPYCVDSKGELKCYDEILDGMISYIKNDHPDIVGDKQLETAQKWLEDGPVWGEIWQGTIILESLSKTEILKNFNEVNRKVEDTSNDEYNYGFSTWTICDFQTSRRKLEESLEDLSNLISEKGSWWMNWEPMKGGEDVYILFHGKIFKGKNSDTKFTSEVNEWARKIGCSEEQWPCRGK